MRYAARISDLKNTTILQYGKEMNETCVLQICMDGSIAKMSSKYFAAI